MAAPTRNAFVAELVQYFLDEGFALHGVCGMDGYDLPPEIRNDGYGSARACRPDVIGFDGGKRRVVFGLVREDREALDSERSLEEYNVFLDHNASLGERASVLYVLLPPPLLEEFTSLVTHYIHREYWHRVVPVASGLVRD